MQASTLETDDALRRATNRLERAKCVSWSQTARFYLHASLNPHALLHLRMHADGGGCLRIEALHAHTPFGRSLLATLHAI